MDFNFTKINITSVRGKAEFVYTEDKMMWYNQSRPLHYHNIGRNHKYITQTATCGDKDGRELNETTV